MLNGDHLERLADKAVVDDVGRAAQPRASDSSVLRGIQFGRFTDSVEYFSDGREK
jgi:hypothetical protein